MTVITNCSNLNWQALLLLHINIITLNYIQTGYGVVGGYLKIFILTYLLFSKEGDFVPWVL